MELVKVTTKDQMTISKSVRKFLELKERSKINFSQNSAMLALKKIQNAFEGETDRLGLKTEEDVVEMINEFRKNKR